MSGSAYGTALDRTRHVLAQRTATYRNLVVAVVLIVAASIGWALAAREPRALAGLLFVVPACGIFFAADARRLNRWRTSLTASWIARDLDFAAFRAAVRADPVLPRGTVEAMLATLPDAGDLTAEQGLATPNRQAIATECAAADRVRERMLVLRAAGAAAGAVAVAAVLWWRA